MKLKIIFFFQDDTHLNELGIRFLQILIENTSNNAISKFIAKFISTQKKELITR